MMTSFSWVLNPAFLRASMALALLSVTRRNCPLSPSAQAHQALILTPISLMGPVTLASVPISFLVVSMISCAIVAIKASFFCCFEKRQFRSFLQICKGEGDPIISWVG